MEIVAQATAAGDGGVGLVLALIALFGLLGGEKFEPRQ
jgi:hypothetical protein